MSNVRRALGFSLAERYLMILMALASNILLARLLTPEQIGIFSVSLGVIALAQVFRDFGVASYLIQEKNLTSTEVRTAFGVTLMLSWPMCLLVWFGADWVSQLYHEPRMISALRVCALNFLVLPFCTISLALLRREMKFRRLAAVNVVSVAVGLVVTVLCALRGLGEISMAIGSVVTNVVTGLGSWLARPQLDAVTPSLRAWRKVVSFGGQSSLSSMVTSVAMDANDLFVAKILGFDQAALLSRAFGLMSMLNRDVMAAVRGVALPAFASAHRGGANVQEQLHKSIAVITVFAWPFYGLLALYALEALRLLYGPQWDAAQPALVAFCAAGAVMAVTALSPTLLTALGRIDLTMRFDLVMQPLRLVLIVAAAFFFKNILACALALLVVAILSVPGFAWMQRIALGDAAAPRHPRLIASGIVTVASLVPAFIHCLLADFSRTEPVSIPSILACLAATTIVWAAAAIAIKHPLADEPLFLKLTGWPGRKWAVFVRGVHPHVE